MSNATVGELTEVRSHTVSDEWVRGKRLASSEELFPRVAGTWRNRPVSVELHARRYVANVHDEATGTSEDRFTSWMVHVGNVRYTDTEYREDATETARERLRDEAIAKVEEWLGTAAYEDSRQRAYSWMLLHRLREDAGSVYGNPITVELLERYRDEVPDPVAERIEKGLAAIETLQEVLQPGSDS